jgi:hypothetical protein
MDSFVRFTLARFREAKDRICCWWVSAETFCRGPIVPDTVPFLGSYVLVAYFPSYFPPFQSSPNDPIICAANDQKN